MNTKQLTITLSVALLLIALSLTITYYVARRQGKKLASVGNKGKLPDATDYGKSLSGSESQLAVQHATALYKDMKGVNIFSRDARIYTDYLATTDRVFVATANYFADNYGDGQNLAQWIKGEQFWFTNFDLQDTTQSILTRLQSHGITA